jgi:hypothetical protein
LKAIIVGDLHGNLPFYKKIRSLTKDKIILLGDLLDSFKYTRAEQLELLKLVLDDIEMGKTECIFGNHELSYLVPRLRATGYASSFDAQIIHLKSRMWKLMKPYILDVENKVLISHAGLSHSLIIEAKVMDGFIYNDVHDLDAFLEQSWRAPMHESYVYYIGMDRGGPDICGGIFWCDLKKEFVPVPGLTQIFGHTPSSTVIKIGDNSWCIDCVEKDLTQLVIKLTDDKVEVVDYEKIQTA